MEKIFLSIFYSHIMLPITKSESLQFLKFSKLPLDVIWDWHNYINKGFQDTVSYYYRENVIYFFLKTPLATSNQSTNL